MAHDLRLLPDDDVPPSPEETLTLLDRIRAGEDAALEALLARLLPRMRRWAHGRLPRAARGLVDTADVVQDIAIKAIRNLAHLQIEHPAALAYYLRTAIARDIIDRWRRPEVDQFQTSAGDSLPDEGTSPLERLIAIERWRRYEAALGRLSDYERAVIVGRFELAYGYDDLARYLGTPTPGAARVAVHRAVKRLTEQARHV